MLRLRAGVRGGREIGAAPAVPLFELSSSVGRSGPVAIHNPTTRHCNAVRSVSMSPLHIIMAAFLALLLLNAVTPGIAKFCALADEE